MGTDLSFGERKIPTPKQACDAAPTQEELLSELFRRFLSRWFESRLQPQFLNFYVDFDIPLDIFIERLREDGFEAQPIEGYSPMIAVWATKQRFWEPRVKAAAEAFIIKARLHIARWAKGGVKYITIEDEDAEYYYRSKPHFKKYLDDTFAKSGWKLELKQIAYFFKYEFRLAPTEENDEA